MEGHSRWIVLQQQTVALWGLTGGRPGLWGDRDTFIIALEEENMVLAWDRAMRVGVLVADQEIGLGGADLETDCSGKLMQGEQFKAANFGLGYGNEDRLGTGNVSLCGPGSPTQLCSCIHTCSLADAYACPHSLSPSLPACASLSPPVTLADQQRRQQPLPPRSLPS